jgi:hypothetical protein
MMVQVIDFEEMYMRGYPQGVLDVIMNWVQIHGFGPRSFLIDQNGYLVNEHELMFLHAAYLLGIDYVDVEYAQ